ncbi:penicillin-insensitive murein endopeptidase [Tropicimonas sediminicola]|uniref:Murein endopeptidase. Metallo peptidase. MEROPS family M74 n=1 Tax=Tropicimonas sediminicola TaxID=1031541 RepID=A0A239KWQ2_9RHOB|nr:penicillin-insensitive murein endopeptidase [Tropicimonas sediminicola]SNT22162.1 murein endopeptidase. Metallo peptidase. MEROPS family M74 [Tropicimonas sediminicola]
MSTIRTILAGALIGLLALPAAAEPKANQLFGAKPTASQQKSQPIGFYSKGCAAGNVELPETGPTWQAMRLSRNRNWGQPVMIEFLQDLSAFATKVGWQGLYIGDISQPRGGPMTSGHSSHQIGLDADIWMKPATNLRLSRRDRENISSIDVRSSDQRSVNGNWTPAHAAILKRAAMDPRVDRIFVTPPVKIEFCKTAKRSDAKWLQKIRPIYGHNYHFHVRLKCPKGARGCVTQSPSVNELSKGGTGCDASLQWWVTDYLNPPKSTKPAAPAPKKRGARDFTMADLPNQCGAVLASR